MGTTTRRKEITPWKHRDNERSARTNTGRWMVSWDAAAGGLLSPSQIGKWPSVPNIWRELEVPYRLWSVTPLVVRAHGVLMNAHPFVPGYRGTTREERRAFACWCAALSQAVQGVASALAAECGIHGRLFWIIDELIARIRTIGGDLVMDTLYSEGELLENILKSIGDVKWHRVDPAGTTCVANAVHVTPGFDAGDAVSWDPMLGAFGSLEITYHLRRNPNETKMRSTHLYGSLCGLRCREGYEGWGQTMPGFTCVPVDEMRVGEPARWERRAAAMWLRIEQRDREQSVPGLGYRGGRGRGRGRGRSRRRGSGRRGGH